MVYPFLLLRLAILKSVLDTQTTDQLKFGTTTKADSRGMFSTPLLV